MDIVVCPVCHNKLSGHGAPRCEACGTECVSPPDAIEAIGTWGAADVALPRVDATKWRIIEFWGDEGTASIRDTQLIQLAQREFLRGAELEASYAEHTLREIGRHLSRDAPEYETIRELIFERHGFWTP